MSTKGNRFGVAEIGDPGRAVVALPLGAAPKDPAEVDHALSECSFGGLHVLAASIRGLMHRRAGTPRQDRFSMAQISNGRSVFAVCDGVGSLPRSGEAAAFVAEGIPRAYEQHGEWDPAIAQVNAELIDHIARVSPDESTMSTTFVGVALTPKAPGEADGWRADLAWTDDSVIWSLTPQGWSLVTRSGDTPAFDGTPHGVRGLPAGTPRFWMRTIEDINLPLFVMSDGVGEPMEMNLEVRDTLAQWWGTPPDIYSFAAQVGFGRKGFFDDRTVIGIWPDRLETSPISSPAGDDHDRRAP